MRRSHIIHHTADKGIRIQAGRLEELFTGALRGMADIQWPEKGPEHASEEVQEQIEIQAPDRTALLIDFLSDVHTLSDIHNAVFDKVNFQLLTDQELKATLGGVRVDAFGEDIKAVTHSQAEIKTNEQGLIETIMVFDI